MKYKIMNICLTCSVPGNMLSISEEYLINTSIYLDHILRHSILLTIYLFENWVPTGPPPLWWGQTDMYMYISMFDVKVFIFFVM